MKTPIDESSEVQLCNWVKQLIGDLNSRAEDKSKSKSPNLTLWLLLSPDISAKPISIIRINASWRNRVASHTNHTAKRSENAIHVKLNYENLFLSNGHYVSARSMYPASDINIKRSSYSHYHSSVKRLQYRGHQHHDAFVWLGRLINIFTWNFLFVAVALGLCLALPAQTQRDESDGKVLT